MSDNWINLIWIKLLKVDSVRNQLWYFAFIVRDFETKLRNNHMIDDSLPEFIEIKNNQEIDEFAVRYLLEQFPLHTQEIEMIYPGIILSIKRDEYINKILGNINDKCK